MLRQEELRQPQRNAVGSGDHRQVSRLFLPPSTGGPRPHSPPPWTHGPSALMASVLQPATADPQLDFTWFY